MHADNIYAPVEDIRKFLWNERDKKVLIGYQPDFRLCDELIETQKLWWNTHLRRVRFLNGMTMSIPGHTIACRRVYLYDDARLRDEWARKKLLVRVRRLLELLTDALLRQYLWHIGQSVGTKLPWWNADRSYLLRLATQWLVHLSTADLEALAALLEQQAAPAQGVAA